MDLTVLLPGQIPEKTRECESCGKLQVSTWTGTAYVTKPLRYQWEWWCACGNREFGDVDPGIVLSLAAEARNRWERVNASTVKRTDDCCAFCRFHKRNELNANRATCRRYAPITVRDVAEDGSCFDRTHFPKMHAEGWCGDFERAVLAR